VDTGWPDHATFQGSALSAASEDVGQRLALGHTADAGPGRRVEPDVVEAQAELVVAEQQPRAADVVVVDVADDEQVDVPLAVGVLGYLQQPAPQRRVGFVRAGVHQHAPGRTADRAADEQAVAEAGGQHFEGDGRRAHAEQR
jgi:hypothetical protein